MSYEDVTLISLQFRPDQNNMYVVCEQNEMELLPLKIINSGDIGLFSEHRILLLSILSLSLSLFVCECPRLRDTQHSCDVC